MLKPYSKEQQIGNALGRKAKIKYTCSDGKKVTQDQINSRLSKEYKTIPFSKTCQCCGKRPAVEHDHTLAQSKCKTLHKTELIWDSRNWSDSCRECHTEWERYKSGKFANHLNVIERMKFIREHDFEQFIKRLEHIKDPIIRESVL